MTYNPRALSLVNENSPIDSLIKTHSRNRCTPNVIGVSAGQRAFCVPPTPPPSACALKSAAGVDEVSVGLAVAVAVASRTCGEYSFMLAAQTHS